MSESIFRTLHHVCIVVRDMKRAVDFYMAQGIGPWSEFPSLTSFQGGLRVPDEQAFIQLRYRYAQLDNVQLQLCEPPEGDTPQRQFLDRVGEGVFHLGFTVEDCDAAECQAGKQGLPVLLAGRKADGSGFTYFDSAQRGAGVTLEVRASAQDRMNLTSQAATINHILF